MSQLVAFLRGINVGGVRIAMADLKACFEDCGMADVKTVLATGNVRFHSEDPAPRARLEAALSQRFGYQAFVFLRPFASLAATVAGYPFRRDDEHHAYVIFVDDETVRTTLLAQGGGEVAPGDGVVYWRCPRGQTTDMPFSKLLTKAAVKTATTNRNVQTLERLLDEA